MVKLYISQKVTVSISENIKEIGMKSPEIWQLRNMKKSYLKTKFQIASGPDIVLCDGECDFCHNPANNSIAIAGRGHIIWEILSPNQGRYHLQLVWKSALRGGSQILETPEFQSDHIIDFIECVRRGID